MSKRSRKSVLALSFIIVTACGFSAVADEPRFSAETRVVLKQVTQAYDLNGKRYPSGDFEETVLARAAKSSDPRLRNVAEHLPLLDMLSDFNKESRKELPQKYLDMLAETSTVLLASAVRADEKAGIEDAITVLEESFVETQRAVNLAWATAYVGNGVGNSLKACLADLARARNPGEQEDRGLIKVELGTGRMLGAITITNTSREPLTNCLIITRLEPQIDRLKRLAREEDAVGQFILPALGFPERVVRGSRFAADMRYKFYQQDKGVVVYVEEIPQGARLTTSLANPAYYRIGKLASASIWCDQGFAEGVPARNWREVVSKQRK